MELISTQYCLWCLALLNITCPHASVIDTQFTLNQHFGERPKTQPPCITLSCYNQSTMTLGGLAI